MHIDEVLRKLNARGYNVYFFDRLNGECLGSFEAAVQRGLAVTQEAFYGNGMKREQGVMPFIVRHGQRFFVLPSCENPNSPEAVQTEIRRLKREGRIPSNLDYQLFELVGGFGPEDFPHLL